MIFFSLREKGLIGYTMENETLVLCFNIRPFNQISEDSMILNNIKREFPKPKLFTYANCILSTTELRLVKSCIRLEINQTVMELWE